MLMRTESIAQVSKRITIPASNRAHLTIYDLQMTKIYVVYYSMYGHVRTMANAVKEGIDSVDGCEATLFQVRFFITAAVSGSYPPYF